MTRIKEFKDKRSIQQEAAEWIIRIDSDVLSEQQRCELAAWLTESRSHQKEFIELARVWGKLDSLEMAKESIAQAPKRKLAKHSLNRIPYAIAASVILVSLLFLPALIEQHSAEIANEPIAKTDTQLYTTQVGELRDIQLEDGSRLKLNTNSIIKVDFSGTERAIFLHQGEANFSVAKNPDRPFVVYVGKGSVTAIGTAFNVRYDGATADVVVTEGVVKIFAEKSFSTSTSIPRSTSKSNSASTATLNNKNQAEAPVKKSPEKILDAVVAGQKVRFDTHTISSVSNLELDAIERELAWHSGMLSFTDTPLHEVIKEISRYTTSKIIIDDPDLANLSVGGYFKAGETEAMLEVLQLGFDIKVTTSADGKVLLAKRDNVIDK